MLLPSPRAFVVFGISVVKTDAAVIPSSSALAGAVNCVNGVGLAFKSPAGVVEGVSDSSADPGAATVVGAGLVGGLAVVRSLANMAAASSFFTFSSATTKIRSGNPH